MSENPKHVYWDSRPIGTVVGTPWHNFPQGFHYDWLTKDPEAFDLALAAYCEFEKTGKNQPKIRLAEHKAEQLHFMGPDVIIFRS